MKVQWMLRCSPGLLSANSVSDEEDFETPPPDVPPWLQRFSVAIVRNDATAVLLCPLRLAREFGPTAIKRTGADEGFADAIAWVQKRYLPEDQRPLPDAWPSDVPLDAIWG